MTIDSRLLVDVLYYHTVFWTGSVVVYVYFLDWSGCTWLWMMYIVDSVMWFAMGLLLLLLWADLYRFAMDGFPFFCRYSVEFFCRL